MYQIEIVQKGDAGQELPGKALDLTVGKRNELIAFEEIEDALTQQIHDDANVPSIVKTITEVDTPIPIVRIVRFEGSEDPQLDSRRISILLYRADDLDSHQLILPSIGRLYDLTKGALAKQFDDLVVVGQLGVGNHIVVTVFVVSLAALVLIWYYSDMYLTRLLWGIRRRMVTWVVVSCNGCLPPLDLVGDLLAGPLPLLTRLGVMLVLAV